MVNPCVNNSSNLYTYINIYIKMVKILKLMFLSAYYQMNNSKTIKI